MLKSKKFRKTISLIMALAFCLCALSLSAVADDVAYSLDGTMNSVLEIMNGTTTSLGNNTNGNITIKLNDGTNGAIFSAYQLLKIENANGVLKVSIPSEAQAFWNEYTGVTNATIKDIKSKIAASGTKAEKSSSIVNAFVSFNNKPTKIAEATTADGKATITTEFGFYAILQTGAPANSYIASAPILACLPMQTTDGDDSTWISGYTAEPKDDTISVTKQVKQVKASDEGTFQNETITKIGDTVSYEIIAELPTYGEDILSNGVTYTITDTPNPTTALTLKSDTIKVYYTTADNATSITEELSADNYDITVDLTDTNKFTFAFKNNFYKDTVNGRYTYLKITYDAILNENAIIESTGNTNTAELKYSSYSDQTETTSATAKVYTMGLDITKIEKDNPAKTLAGAEFEVYTNAAGTEANRLSFIDITGDGGIKRYRVAAPGETGTTTTTIKVTDSGTYQGQIKIDGLDNATYYLKEITPPTGYNLPTSLFAIDVQPTAYTDGTAADDYDGNTGILLFDDTRLSMNIENATGIDLPVTGGMGTVLFTAIGLLLMAGAAFLLFKGKKSNN